MEISKANPFVILSLFLSIIVITMITKNPIFIGISFVSSSTYTLLLLKPKKMLKRVLFIFVLIILATITNPFFNNHGSTILFKVGKTNFTFESLFYGFISSLMIISVILWFYVLNYHLSNDKILYIFSKHFPRLALIITNFFKLIPELITKINSLNESEKILGMNYSKGFIARVKSKFLLLGNLFSYQVENAIVTAQAMKARGYGLKNKTNYHRYTFKVFDLFLLIFIVCLLACIFILGNELLLNYSFFPLISKIESNISAIISYLLFALLSIYPTLNLIKENIKWHYLKLKTYHLPMH